ncbi:hypothetical protein M3Y99_00388800 [Aphelenchoides fujianensis]|nr:hypothetical protein M3Y99_00388800 [Aphelenchoides fujianensis]
MRVLRFFLRGRKSPACSSKTALFQSNAMEGSPKKDEMIVYFTVHLGVKEKSEMREMVGWKKGRTIASILDDLCGKYPYSKCTCERIVDVGTKSQISRDHLVEKGGVYAVEMKEKTVAIQLKVNDEESKEVQVPRSLWVSELGKSQGIDALSTSVWHPVNGYVQLDAPWLQNVQDGAAYGIKSKAVFGYKDAAQKKSQSNTSSEWGFCLLPLIVLFFLIGLIALLAFLTREQKKSTANWNAPFRHASGNDEVVALLREMNRRFAAQQETMEQLQAEGRAERAALSATIGELQEQIADLRRGNVSVLSTSPFTREPTHQLTGSELTIICVLFCVVGLTMLVSLARALGHLWRARQCRSKLNTAPTLLRGFELPK